MALRFLTPICFLLSPLVILSGFLSSWIFALGIPFLIAKFVLVALSGFVAALLRKSLFSKLSSILVPSTASDISRVHSDVVLSTPSPRGTPMLTPFKNVLLRANTDYALRHADSDAAYGPVFEFHSETSSEADDDLHSHADHPEDSPFLETHHDLLARQHSAPLLGSLSSPLAVRFHESRDLQKAQLQLSPSVIARFDQLDRRHNPPRTPSPGPSVLDAALISDEYRFNGVYKVSHWSSDEYLSSFNAGE
ncbi:uncharacterized protein BJ171DRAFT_585421 [Polychytrium aggregatum]|uniref:uncharacterized protein n=1 Tax=Polychytrium aggregatum TaxID=110093 RepID=UPI0022FE6532|nr:uncharacterized protein BJ171DRAFT_585421 [Polychytrium aggregatum]KAI9199395.1 hypothetical protein BJ171DRAFT_585421 [Polychytrium aggregatum]